MRCVKTILRCAAMLGACAVASALAQSQAPSKEAPISAHARGTLDVKVEPLNLSDIHGIARFSIDKTIHGDLEATTKGEMYSAGDPKAGTAGYVAMEIVRGSLAGRSGSFVLQHFATMDARGREMIVKVAPGSGTDELGGIAGTFTIIVADGKHSYDFEYKLPGK